MLRCIYTLPMRVKNFSGPFLVFFVLAAAVTTCFFMPAAGSKTGTPHPADIIQGTWAVRFEKALGEVLPVYDPSRHFWGWLDYTLFRQGRKGVVIGADGWLFTDEEFSCPPHSLANTSENLRYISTVRDILKEKGTRLVVVLIPAKARLYADRLARHKIPPCRLGLYADAHAALTAAAIPAADLLAAMIGNEHKDKLYLKTDTHWSPDGAKLAAEITAQSLKGMAIKHDPFTITAGETAPHIGDLTRYVPGVGAPAIIPDTLTSFSATGPETNDLFSDNVPDVTLVGTSYSANSLWGFEGFLKTALQSDLLNMADEGLGPFAVMDAYLGNDVWKKTPPRLLIWEIPERYIMMPRNHRTEK